MPSEQQENHPDIKQPGDDSNAPQQNGHSRKSPIPGRDTVSTSDPAINSPGAMAAPPGEVVSFQTSQVYAPPQPCPFEAGGDVVEERRDRKEANEQGAKSSNKRSSDDQGEPHHDQPSMHGRREPATRLDWKTLAVTALVALICGMGGAWGYSAFVGPSKSDKQASSSDKRGTSGNSGGKQAQSGSDKQSAGREGGASASDIPGFNSAKDADTFKKELEHLAHRIDLLGGRIDQLTQPENEAPPVVHTLQMKMNDLEREVDQVAGVPSHMRQLEQKIANLKEDLKTLKEGVQGEDLPTGSEFAPAENDRPDMASPPLGSRDDLDHAGADPADDATMKLATGLLREGHAEQAYEVLRRLQRERPNDARVWYLSALANGSSTGKWDGKTERLVEQGIACERAGRPSQEKIDAAISGIEVETGTPWLAEQRQKAQTR